MIDPIYESTIWQLTVYNTANKQVIMQDRFTDSFIFEVMNMHCSTITVESVLAKQDPLQWSGFCDGSKVLDIQVVSPYVVSFVNHVGSIHAEEFVHYDQAYEEFMALCDLTECSYDYTSPLPDYFTIGVMSHTVFNRPVFDHVVEFTANE